jgi:hypothetical protein
MSNLFGVLTEKTARSNHTLASSRDAHSAFGRCDNSRARDVGQSNFWRETARRQRIDFCFSIPHEPEALPELRQWSIWLGLVE